MDFSKLSTAKTNKAPIEPIKLFESLPSLANTPNDLWRGQAEALENWHVARNEKDVLVTLNTGAGKTIVGLLIAQSLVNEGKENVIYVCSTIDLVNQTAAEADRIGIKYTLRSRQEFSNDLFQTGNAFCITTYAALFSGHSALRRKHFPEAIVFDDAHVAEGMLRDSFTLRINSGDYPNLFKELAELFRPHFNELGNSGRFADSLTREHSNIAFAAPRGTQERAAQLHNIFARHKVKDLQDLTYAYAHLEDHLEACAVIFSKGVFELSPPFLPSLALDIFERPLNRVYLSATLQSQTEFIRAFGRLPSKTIMPSNDAGNGERLIVFGREINNGFSNEFVRHVVGKQKVVIAVPSYGQAERWREIAVPPTPENFSEELNAFRRNTNGAFTLVSRVDGIDLPHDTCRVMLMDGLPGGTSLLERYQWEFLRMTNVHAVRVANRLAQLFGRINRGRNDYGVFFIEGSDLNIWLNKDRNVSLLPPLLQQQVVLGRQVQQGMGINNAGAAIELMEAVLGREETWVEHYQTQVKLAEVDEDQVQRMQTSEPYMVIAALAEAKYAASIWTRDYHRAREAIEQSINNTSMADTPLGGWHSVWLGAVLDLEGDRVGANRSYAIARSRIGPAIALPRGPQVITVNNDAPDLSAFGVRLQSYLGYSDGAKIDIELNKLRTELDWITSGSSHQAEAGVKKLGELLGFSSTRPDNDQHTGPDVLWIDEEVDVLISFELKTDKKGPPTVYFKDDINQGHDHLSWVANQYPSHTNLGLLFVGPDGTVDNAANPSDEMGLCLIETMASLRNEIIAIIEDLRRQPPLERVSMIAKETSREKWNLEKIAERLWDRNLKN